LKSHGQAGPQRSQRGNLNLILLYPFVSPERVI
jgi:hypothetical protein